MIISLTFKTPDIIYDALLYHQNYDEEKDEFVSLSDEEKESVQEFLERFVKHGEYVTINFDTEKETAIVQKVLNL